MLLASHLSHRRHVAAALIDRPDDPVLPADYVRMRREAAGLTRQEVARRLASLRLRTLAQHRPIAVSASTEEALALIDQLETPGVKARHRSTIAAIAAVLPIDPDVYHQLATEPADRHPTICRGCGCSAHDTCGGEDGVCSLSLSGTCSRCTDAGAA